MKWTLETNQLLSPPAIAKNKLVLHITEVTFSIISKIDLTQSELSEYRILLCE